MGRKALKSDDELEREIDEEFQKLEIVGPALQKVIDTASSRIWTQDGRVVPGLKELHDRTIRRTEEILDKIQTLQSILNARKN
jgi:hypothetical protein